MSDLLDDFIAYLEQGNNEQREPNNEKDVVTIIGPDATGATGDLPEDDRLDGEGRNNNKKKGFQLGSVAASKQPAYKSGMKLPRLNVFSDEFDGNPVTIEFLGMRIRNANLTADTLKQSTSGKKVIKLTEIPFHVNRSMNEISDDWITAGVIIDRQQFPSKATGKMFTIIKLSDLRNTIQYVSLFLFERLHEQFYDLPNGTVIGLLNPVFMPPQHQVSNGKMGKFGNKNKNKRKDEICALKLDHEMKLLRIGMSADFGRCPAEKADGEFCNAVINKSISKTCVFHVNQEYRKMMTARPDLKATYSGIIPKTDEVEIQQSIVDKNFALLGPCGVSSKAKEKVKEQISKAAEQLSVTNEPEKTDGSQAEKKQLTEAEMKAVQKERKRKLQEAIDVRRQLEAEMVAEAIRNPLTLAARNLAKVHQTQGSQKSASSQIPDGERRNKQMTTSTNQRSVNVSNFSSADQIFAQLKPIRPEIVSAPRPQLARGSTGPGSNVFLDVDLVVKKKVKRRPVIPVSQTEEKPHTAVPVDSKSVENQKQHLHHRHHPYDRVKVNSETGTAQKPKNAVKERAIDKIRRKAIHLANQDQE